MSIAAEVHKMIATLPKNQEASDFERLLRSKEERGRDILHNSFAFAEAVAVDRSGGPLEEVFISPVKSVQETLNIWLTLLDTIARRENKDEMLDALAHFNDFLTYFWLEGVEKGLAVGVVTEQYRSGLMDVLKKNERDFSYGDSVSVTQLADICEKYGISTGNEGAAHRAEEEAAN